MNDKTAIIPFERIASVIHVIRGQKVMLDRDLAVLYGVETRALNQAVKRNCGRFPSDFMLELTREEIRNISQSVISSATLTFEALQQLTSERPSAIGFQYIGSGDSGSAQETTVKERRAVYRVSRKRRRA